MLDFSDPYTMAQHLSRRRMGVSAIYRAVVEQFGHSPSTEEIFRMKSEYNMRRIEMRAAARISDDRLEYMSEAERREAMRDGCEALLRAIWRSHGPILNRLKARGLNVVLP